MKKVAVVIVGYNTKSLLKICLTSLLKNLRVLGSKNFKKLEVVVVDNGSTDGSIEELMNLKPKFQDNNFLLKIVENKKNFGFAKGNNIGIKEAIADGVDYVGILNSDTYVRNDFLSPLLEVLEKKKDAGIVGPKIYFAPGHEFYKNRYQKKELGKVIWSAGGLMDWENIYGSNRGVDEVDRGQYQKVDVVESISGCCFLTKAFIWKEVNFFDERYFMYYEDADFCEKVKRLGYKIYFVPQSEIWHVNAGSSSVGGALQDYFISRNRMLFGFKWASLKTKMALIRESMRILLNGRFWQKRGIVDFYLRRFGRGSFKV